MLIDIQGQDSEKQNQKQLLGCVFGPGHDPKRLKWILLSMNEKAPRDCPGQDVKLPWSAMPCLAMPCRINWMFDAGAF